LYNWITIKTFTLPIEAAIIRGRLESEGIECFLTNELTTQVNPLYSNAIGGVELQVRESDLQNAIAILKEGGYLPDEDALPSTFLLKLDSITLKIPFLKKLQLLLRLMILVAVFVGAIVSFIIYANLPTTSERLTANKWCLDNVVYDNKKFIPETDAFIKFIGSGFCNESITFLDNGKVTFPGFKSNSVWAHWQLENDFLIISRADTFDFVYNGLYKLEFSNNQLILKSEKTTLNCHKENIHINLPF